MMPCLVLSEMLLYCEKNCLVILPGNNLADKESRHLASMMKVGNSQIVAEFQYETL